MTTITAVHAIRTVARAALRAGPVVAGGVERCGDHSTGGSVGRIARAVPCRSEPLLQFCLDLFESLKDRVEGLLLFVDRIFEFDQLI